MQFLETLKSYSRDMNAVRYRVNPSFTGLWYDTWRASMVLNDKISPNSENPVSVINIKVAWPPV